jgi:hypothetical protein
MERQLSSRCKESLRRDTIGGLHRRYGYFFFPIFVEKVKERWVAAVVEAEAAEEVVVGDEATPALADEGGSREGMRRRISERRSSSSSSVTAKVSAYRTRYVPAKRLFVDRGVSSRCFLHLPFLFNSHFGS